MKNGNQEAKQNARLFLVRLREQPETPQDVRQAVTKVLDYLNKPPALKGGWCGFPGINP